MPPQKTKFEPFTQASPYEEVIPRDDQDPEMEVDLYHWLLPPPLIHAKYIEVPLETNAQRLLEPEFTAP